MLLTSTRDDGSIILPASDAPRPLPRSPENDAAPFLDLLIETPTYGETTVREVLDRHAIRGLVVVHDGSLVLEWYRTERDEERRNPCFSVTKSLTGTLVAMAVDEGLLDRAATVSTLVPELAASGFAEATVADLADMTVAIGYREDYDESSQPTGDGSALTFGDYLIALRLEPDGVTPSPDAPRSIRALLARIEHGPGAHGDVFEYMTPASDALGWVLERATGQSYPQLLFDRLWRYIGAERDALLSTDPDGTPLMGAGLSMTTRDLARFGMLLASAARSEAEHVVPRHVIDRIRAGGDPEVFARNDHYSYLQGYTYRDQWWLPERTSRPLSAWGIYGQVLWVDPDANLSIACHAGGDVASDARRDVEQDAMFKALTDRTNPRGRAVSGRRLGNSRRTIGGTARRSKPLVVLRFCDTPPPTVHATPGREPNAWW